MNFDRQHAAVRFEYAAARVCGLALVCAAALTASWTAHAASHSAGAAPAKPAAPATAPTTAPAAPAAPAAAAAQAPAAAAPATGSCNQQATEKKLAGAARTGNVNKCVKEAVGG